MRATWLLGGTGALLATSAAFASPFSIDLVVNEQVFLGESLFYEEPRQVVAGSGGVVVTNTIASGEQYIMLHAGGSTTLLAGPDDQGWDEFSDVALSPNGTITFQAGSPSFSVGLYQAQVSGGSPIRVDAVGQNLNPVPQVFEDVHYQVNASGTLSYKYTEAGTRKFSTATGATTLDTVVEPATVDGLGVRNFNQLSGNIAYRRQAITANGSVVFYAESNTLSPTPGIYRMAPGGAVSDLNLSGITVESRVLGASDDAVLYTSVNAGTRTVNFQIGAGPAVPLASYSDALASPRNAVMTQQNRVAYFDPGGSAAAIKYYDPLLGVLAVAAEGQTITDNVATYTIAQLSMDDMRRSNPMLNDHGVVVFDAILTPGDESGDVVQALLMWDTTTQITQIVVKAEETGGIHADDFGGGKVLALGFDFLTDQGGDVLKDGLSEDNWLAFTLAYSDEFEDIHIGVARTHVPEPSLVASLGAAAAGALLRRRRTRG